MSQPNLVYHADTGICQGVGLNAPTDRYDPPLLPILYPHLKKEAHPLPNHFCILQNSRHANEGTSLQGDFYHEPNQSAQTHRPDLLPNGQFLRNRTTLAHIPSTRAQVGQTRPTTRRTRTKRPTQNPQTPTHPNRTRHRSVLQLHQKIGYGRRRLARHLAQQGIHLSPHTIRHSLRRHAPTTTRTSKSRRRFYPAHGAWENQAPFTLIQADVKDIDDKGTLGTERWDHLRQHRLPRYQWTFLESRPRLRLMTYSRAISVLHGMAFWSLAVSWLLLLQTEMTIHTNHRARVHKEEPLMIPSFRFPLRAGGTEWARDEVPLAKRGEPAGGGN